VADKAKVPGHKKDSNHKRLKRFLVKRAKVKLENKASKGRKDRLLEVNSSKFRVSKEVVLEDRPRHLLRFR
jgi:hypothetical protein